MRNLTLICFSSTRIRRRARRTRWFVCLGVCARSRWRLGRGGCSRVRWPKFATAQDRFDQTTATDHSMVRAHSSHHRVLAADLCGQRQRQRSSQQHLRPYFGRKHDSFRASKNAVDSQRWPAAPASAFIRCSPSTASACRRNFVQGKTPYARGRIN